MTHQRGERDVVRQWRILNALMVEPQPKTRRELADRFGVDPKTIGRDIAALEEAFFQIEMETRGQTAHYSLHPDFKHPPAIPLSLEELAALYVARAEVAQIAASPYEAALASAFDKIQIGVPKPVRDFCDRLAALAARQVRGRPKASPRPEVLAALNLAILEGRRATIRYRPRGAIEAILLEMAPQQLRGYRDTLYAICWSPEKKAYRTLATERIDAVEPLDRFFPRRDEDEIEEEFASAFGFYTGKPFRFVVRFAPALASYIEDREWHVTERTERLEDGGILYTAVAAGRLEIKAWVLGFGANATILEPEWLRREVAADIETMKRAYNSP